MEAENHSSDESVSSVPCMEFQYNYNSLQNNLEISNVGLTLGARVDYGPVRAEQIYQNSPPNNSGLCLKRGSANPRRINFTHAPLFFDLTWSAPLRAHHHNSMPLRLQFPPKHFPYHDHQRHYIQPIQWLTKSDESYEGSSHQVLTSHVSQTSKSSYKQILDQFGASRFNHMIRKRAQDGSLKHCTVRGWPRSSIHIKDGIGNGKMKDLPTHIWPLITLMKNPLASRITNSVYDIMFEEVGLPIDPHLRLFVSL